MRAMILLLGLLFTACVPPSLNPGGIFMDTGRTEPDLVVHTVTATVQVFWHRGDTAPLPGLEAALQKMDRCAQSLHLPHDVAGIALEAPLHFCSKTWLGERGQALAGFTECTRFASGSDATNLFWSMDCVVHETFDHRAEFMTTYDPHNVNKGDWDTRHLSKVAGSREQAVFDCLFPFGPPKVKDPKTGKMVTEIIQPPPHSNDLGYDCVD